MSRGQSGAKPHLENGGDPLRVLRKAWARQRWLRRRGGIAFGFLALTALLQEQGSQFLVDGPSGTDVHDIERGIVIVNTVDDPMPTDPVGPQPF